MWFSTLVTVLALQGGCQAACISTTSREELASPKASNASAELTTLAASALKTAKSLLAKQVAAGNSTCTEDKIQVRREWGTLSKADKLDYISAVQCLMKKPSKTPASLVPAARSRYDDFIATHMNQTLTIHNTANFLTWHRYFTWLYEDALRTECGYKGAASPYWDWSLTAQTGLAASPIFDGSSTSLSGDGDHVKSNGSIVLPGAPGQQSVVFPPGNGGGCVTNGPFGNRTIFLGPVGLAVPGNKTEAHGDGFTDNPRCWKRDLNDFINKKFADADAVLAVQQPPDISAFQNVLQGTTKDGGLGVHGGGHFSLGGDPASDPYISPGDPAFYLHHSMIDRVWWMWQMADPENRMNAVSGTRTFNNNPPSANGTLDDISEFGFAAGPPRKMRDLVSTTGGPFCYVYE